MSSWNFLLSWVVDEKSFYNLGAWLEELKNNLVCKSLSDYGTVSL